MTAAYKPTATDELPSGSYPGLEPIYKELLLLKSAKPSLGRDDFDIRRARQV
jgi:hypothetical protein